MSKRLDLSVGQKLHILRLYDELPKCSQREAAFRLKISQSFLCRLLQNRNSLNNNCQTTFDYNRVRKRESKNSEVEHALVQWVKKAKQINEQVNRKILIQKAKELAVKLGYSDFKPSDGWLTRLKIRNNMTYEKFHHSGKKSNCVSSNKLNETLEMYSIDSSVNQTTNDSDVSEQSDNQEPKPKKGNLAKAPALSEVKQALSVVRKALDMHDSSKLKDFQNFLSLERAIEKMYS